VKKIDMYKATRATRHIFCLASQLRLGGLSPKNPVSNPAVTIRVIIHIRNGLWFIVFCTDSAKTLPPYTWSCLGPQTI